VGPPNGNTAALARGGSVPPGCGTWRARAPTRAPRGSGHPATPAAPTATPAGPGRAGLAELAQETRAWRITVCHFPPGRRSKWNKIEHKLVLPDHPRLGVGRPPDQLRRHHQHHRRRHRQSRADRHRRPSTRSKYPTGPGNQRTRKDERPRRPAPFNPPMSSTASGNYALLPGPPPRPGTCPGRTAPARPGRPGRPCRHRLSPAKTSQAGRPRPWKSPGAPPASSASTLPAGGPRPATPPATRTKLRPDRLPPGRDLPLPPIGATLHRDRRRSLNRRPRHRQRPSPARIARHPRSRRKSSTPREGRHSNQMTR